jgi:alkylation response protein AidB-like acyl-CoA dehydrogenase
MSTTELDDAAALREAVRELLDRECPPQVVRAGWPGGDGGLVAAAWRHLADTGVPAVLVPVDTGGLGLDETHLVAVLEETGYAGLPGPTVETVAVAAPLLATSARHADLLADVLAGRATVTATVQSGPVPYGETADAVLVFDDARGVTLVRAAGREREAVAGVDGSRRLARLDLSGAEAVEVDGGAVGRARLRGTLGTSAELIGLSRRMLAMTVAYVSGREQFGVPIGSFQAVKHHLADALLAVEFAAPLVSRAAVVLAGGAPTARRDVSMAKATASDAARSVAKLTLQCHGAMAYTTEYDHHLFAKRAWAQAVAWGGADAHRAVVAAELGLTRGGDRP